MDDLHSCYSIIDILILICSYFFFNLSDLMPKICCRSYEIKE
jgi:hypothetical protein